MAEIRHANVLYLNNIKELGGTESFVWYFVKKYHYLDICVVAKHIVPCQRVRLEEYCPVYVHKTEEIFCDAMFINSDTTILPFVKQGKVYMTIHADFTQPNNLKLVPNFNDERVYMYLGITKYICESHKQKFNADLELCYNPLVPEKKEKRLVLVTASRLSAIKGGERMKALARELDKNKINYIWYVFTNDKDTFHLPNMIFLEPRLDVYKWVQEADYLVQLSDTEALSYSINESMSYGTPVIVTPLPYLDEIGITNENALILDFDLKNIKDVVERIKNVKRVNWSAPDDDYIKYLSYKLSAYEEEKKKMKRVQVKVKFYDMKNGVNRSVGEEFDEVNDRADLIISKGFAVEVEPVKAEEKQAVKEIVEVAIKEERKKEKAVRQKKNAKK